MTTLTPTKDSRERSPGQYIARATELERQQDELVAQIRELRLQGLSGDQIADSLKADRDPALMQVTTFLMWLDQASLDELESFGRGEAFDVGIRYDHLARMYFDCKTCVRWVRE